MHSLLRVVAVGLLINIRNGWQDKQFGRITWFNNDAGRNAAIPYYIKLLGLKVYLLGGVSNHKIFASSPTPIC